MVAKEVTEQSTVVVLVVNVVDKLVVVTIVRVVVSVVNVVDELVVDSVVKVDVLLLLIVLDEFLNGHCENEYENDKKGKYFDPFLSIHPRIESIFK
jgi:hypothetical protein